MHCKPNAELQVRTTAAAHLEFGEQAALVNESEDGAEPTCHIGLGRIPCSKDMYDRPTALIDLPSGVDLVFVEKLHVD